MDWDDLRYVLAISRGGGLAAAARELQVNNSSVYRRLEKLEAQLEVRLFERLRSGYQLTDAGETLAEAAQRMEGEALAAERIVMGTDLKLEGHILLSTSEALAYFVLPQLLADFRETYPGISLSVSANNQLVDLTRRDADVVIRGTSSPPEHLVGRSAGRLGFAAYAHPDYLARMGRGRPLSEYDWIGYDGAMSRVVMGIWTDKNIPQARIKLRFDTIGGVSQAVRAGLGCASLSCFSAEHERGLALIPGSQFLSQVEVWILTHPDLRKSARIRACMQFFGTRLSAMSAQFLGENAA